MAQGKARDVVVLGGGLAGLRAASVAAQAGAQVTLLEKQEKIGGSSALSAGMFWTAPDLDSYWRRIPHGNGALAARVLGSYDADLAALRASGVHVDDEPTTDVMGFGRGYSFDVAACLRFLAARLGENGGEVRTGVRVLSVGNSPVRRFRLDLETSAGSEELHADAIVFATGGFQASPDARAAHMPNVGRGIVLRSNPGSTGDGLRLARSLGGSLAGDLGTFYGHLIPHPVHGFTPENFMLFSQYYSNHGILVAPDGRRFADESRGDEILNQDLSEVEGMTAFLIFDDGVRSTYGVAEPFANFGRIDRFEFAVRGGARHAVANSLPELAVRLGGLGVDATQLAATLAGDLEVSSLAARASRAQPPTLRQLEKLRKPPFYALEVQPSITFTLGGLAIDEETRVLDAAGNPLTGLFAAGADLGGLSNYGYTGGLAPAHITGGIAGASASRLVTGSAHAKAVPAC